MVPCRVVMRLVLGPLLGAVSVQVPAGRHSSRAATDGCPNLAVFLDGTWDEPEKPCEWVQDKTCETNIPVLWRLACEGEDPSKQRCHYEKGVGSSGNPDDDGNRGVGTKKHMLNAYRWLSQNYGDCGNKIYIFGASRGASSARMLQGMIHRVGVAKPGHAEEAESLHFSAWCSKASLETFRQASTWGDAKVHHLGLMDAVLRTLLDPLTHLGRIASFHMQLTPTVLSFSHAMALDDVREIFDVAELFAPEGTRATQVWFFGQHNDVLGGWGYKDVQRIAGGWTADQAEAEGLLLKPGWRELDDMKVDYNGDSHSDRGLAAAGGLLGPINMPLDIGVTLVRNPMRCRDHASHPLKGQPVYFHQSVKDRMEANPGWQPLPTCCHDSLAGVEYVSNEHYDLRKATLPQKHWLKLTFGRLKGAPRTCSVASKYYLSVRSWSGKDIPDGPIHKYDGPSSPVKVHPGHDVVAEAEGSCTMSQDFRGKTFVRPSELAFATRLVVEVYEVGLLWDGYVGRLEIGLGEGSTGGAVAHPITFEAPANCSSAGGGSLEVTVEEVATDAEAAELMESERGPAEKGGAAQCKWLRRQSGLGWDQLCHPRSLFGGRLNLGGPGGEDCEAFIQDITNGA